MASRLSKQSQKSITTINMDFSFHKLKSKIKGIIDDEYTKYGEVLADLSISNLIKGVDQEGSKLKPLSGKTKSRRRRGRYPGVFKNNPAIATSSEKPLTYTGDLEKSIKGINQGFSMNDYGDFHDRGVSTKVGGETVGRPERSFIAKPDGKQFQDRAKKELIVQFATKLCDNMRK
mgnify:FL=1